MLKHFKINFDKGMPIITYIKKNFGFSSVEEFENYIHDIQHKATKYDQLMHKHQK